MADKQITVDVPQERVAEFYAWFAQFLAAERGFGGPRGRRGGFGPGGHRGGFGHHGWQRERRPWTTDDVEEARWLYGKLSDPAREMFDLLMQSPGEAISGNDLASRLKIDKGAHGVAGILAWPGRWSARLGRDFPIETASRDDGGTDYSMDADTAALFTQAKQ